MDNAVEMPFEMRQTLLLSGDLIAVVDTKIITAQNRLPKATP